MSIETEAKTSSWNISSREFNREESSTKKERTAHQRMVMRDRIIGQRRRHTLGRWR